MARRVTHPLLRRELESQSTEFDRELKNEECRNPSEVYKQLNDET